MRKTIITVAISAAGVVLLVVAASMLLTFQQRGELVTWISAIGGWAGAVVAVPTLVLLGQQTGAAQRQNQIAVIDAWERRIEQLRYEAKLIGELIDRLSDRPVFPWNFMIHPIVQDNFKRESSDRLQTYIASAEAVVRAMNSSLAEFPNESLKEDRQFVIVTAQQCIDNALQIWNRVSGYDANVNEQLARSEQLAHSVLTIVYIDRTIDNALTGLRNLVLERLNGLSARIDVAAGLH